MKRQIEGMKLVKRMRLRNAWISHFNHRCIFFDNETVPRMLWVACILSIRPE